MKSEKNNTIRRNEQELRALLDELDRSDGERAGAKRAHARVQFRRAFIPITLTSVDNQRNELVMACRNISSSGMSLLHSSFVYPKTRGRIRLRHRLRGEVELVGTVVRCAHVRGHIHEVGLHFDEPIDVQAFADIDHLAQQYSLERVKPEDLVGRIIVLSDNTVLLRIIQHYLRETTLAVAHADSIDKAISTIDGRSKLILADHDMTGEDVLTLMSKASAKGTDLPVLIMSADMRPATRERFREAGALGFLKKPLEETALLRGLAEFILPGVRHSSAEGRVRSSLPGDSPLRPLVETFLEDLRRVGKLLQKALEGDDMEAFIRACNKIQGTAPSLGFESIADLATEALNTVNSTMSLTESREAAGKLIGQCERAAA